MRRLLAVCSCAAVLFAVLAVQGTPAAANPEPSHEVLACRGNGAGCDGSADCCSKNCCAVNNHNKCVSASAAQHLSCR